MKKIFIKDDRLREINADLNAEIARLMKTGELKGSYVIKESTKEFPTKEFPFYEILFGWEVIDYEDGWKIKKKGAQMYAVINKRKQIRTNNIQNYQQTTLYILLHRLASGKVTTQNNECHDQSGKEELIYLGVYKWIMKNYATNQRTARQMR